MDVGESADDAEGSIVGNEECSADFGELREGGFGQAGAVDKGEGAPDHGQVCCRDGGEGRVKESQVACDVSEAVEADACNVTERAVLNGEEFGEVECELRRIGGDVESTIDFLELRL